MPLSVFIRNNHHKQAGKCDASSTAQATHSSTITAAARSHLRVPTLVPFDRYVASAWREFKQVRQLLIHTQDGGLGQAKVMGFVSKLVWLSSSGRTSPARNPSSLCRLMSTPSTAACSTNFNSGVLLG